ncbi:MAG: helix-turn-helix domain-containing protein [Sphaerochaeta sp.]|jgi:transcriptional regulator with XRE-family HTH domain|nr:helix-turn-helix domain-containing protein [Sphaerochaeta sp.]MDD3058828.1 helix-turn-helix domain-containing protein [Sphaerochaeta sp.]
MATLGERIKEMRKSSGMTQSELAEKLGMTKGTISAWESDARRPDFEALDSMCDLFHATIDYLLGRAQTNFFREAAPEEQDRLAAMDLAEMYEGYVKKFLRLEYSEKQAIMAKIDSSFNRGLDAGTLSPEDEMIAKVWWSRIPKVISR